MGRGLSWREGAWDVGCCACHPVFDATKDVLLDGCKSSVALLAWSGPSIAHLWSLPGIKQTSSYSALPGTWDGSHLATEIHRAIAKAWKGVAPPASTLCLHSCCFSPCPTPRIPACLRLSVAGALMMCDLPALPTAVVLSFMLRVGALGQLLTDAWVRGYHSRA